MDIAVKCLKLYVIIYFNIKLTSLYWSCWTIYAGGGRNPAQRAPCKKERKKVNLRITMEYGGVDMTFYGSLVV